ncbi:MAG: hypothetical protein M3P51_18355 [Chloroflexota bacterium]|nr:hypothetical protein [Chloroflexota bacterium]
MEYVCERLGDRPGPVRVGEAARLRTALTRRILLSPLPGALEGLAELRESGYAVGLISDCRGRCIPAKSPSR